VVPKAEVALRLAVHDGHHVLPVAAAHRVGHHVQTRAQPGRHRLGAQANRQRRLRQHGTEGQVARGARLTVAPHFTPYLTPQAISAHQHITFDALSALQLESDPFPGRRRMHPLHRRSLVQDNLRVVADSLQQQVVQISTVDGGIGRPITSLGATAQGQRP